MAGDLGEAIERILEERIVVSFTATHQDTFHESHPFGRQVAVVAYENIDADVLVKQVLWLAVTLLPNFVREKTFSEYGQIDDVTNSFAGTCHLTSLVLHEHPEVASKLSNRLAAEFVAYQKIRGLPRTEGMVLNPYYRFLEDTPSRELPAGAKETQLVSLSSVLH